MVECVRKKLWAAQKKGNEEDTKGKACDSVWCGGSHERGEKDVQGSTLARGLQKSKWGKGLGRLLRGM